jgi:hypothetical protein
MDREWRLLAIIAGLVVLTVLLLLFMVYAAGHPAHLHK